jgi:hypothetical protein
MKTVIELLKSIITKKLKSKNFHNECMKELSTFIFPKVNSKEDVAILIEEMKNYSERYFTYYAILYLTYKKKYDRVQEEMIVYECIKELYDIHENHEILTDYMALLLVNSSFILS